jgi:hypothetical protein
MERRETIQVKSGTEYDHLFPKAMLTTIVKKEGATVADTIKFIPKVVNDTLFHTAKIAKLLKGDTVYETCHNIWDFVYDHIAYRKDEQGKEQVRSPARSWHDRGNNLGVDCDCYTVFISSILSNLNIRHKLRITKYSEDHFQHIYPIVPLKNGSHITIDCVVRNFDYEEPYSEKKDTNMDLEYLNGVDDSIANKSIDALGLSGQYDDKEGMAELNRILNNGSSMGDLGRTKKKGKLKELLKKGFHLTNILNPATATIRAGVLLSAKLNIMKIGERLKWAYMSDEDAKKQKGIDMGRFAKLKKIKDKMEQIFYAMGGKPANLKKAILTGKGNKHHEVSGLGYVPDDMNGIDETSSTQTILGTEMYHDELSGVQTENDGLGIVAATAIASATGVIAAIAALLKTVGGVFKKKEDGGGDGGDGTGTGGGGGDTTTPTVDVSGGGGGDTKTPDTKTPDTSTDTTNSDATNGANNKVALKKTDAPATTNDDNSTDDGSGDAGNNSNARSMKKNGDTSGAGNKDTTTKPDSKAKTFWLNNKKWIKPTAFGVGGLIAFFTGLHFYKKHQKEKEESPPPKKQAAADTGVSGIPKSNKKKKGGKKAKGKNNKKKTAVALL